MKPVNNKKQTNRQNFNAVHRTVKSYCNYQLLTSKNDVWITLRNTCQEDTSVISNLKFTHVSSCLIVKDIAQTVFRCTETIKKTSSANINTVAHRQKTKVFWDSTEYYVNLPMWLRLKSEHCTRHTIEGKNWSIWAMFIETQVGINMKCLDAVITGLEVTRAQSIMRWITIC